MHVGVSSKQSPEGIRLCIYLMVLVSKEVRQNLEHMFGVLSTPPFTCTLKHPSSGTLHSTHGKHFNQTFQFSKWELVQLCVKQ